MVNYSNSKIYKLWSDQSDCFYIGSTTQPLNKRLNLHRSAIKKGKNQTSIEMRTHTNIRIELIENFPCSSKEELHAKEGHYIRLHRKQLTNKYIAGRTDEQYRVEHRDKQREYGKNYHREHREEQLVKRQQYYNKNKDIMLKQMHDYYIEHREHKLEYAKQYREAKRAEKKAASLNLP